MAAAGLFVGGVAMPSAKAADLGGDCCADLEERVAELEATTARKGNRKMSLTITGQVHRIVLWWDDGHSSDTYYGLDNTNSSSRFSFLGRPRSPEGEDGLRDHDRNRGWRHLLQGQPVRRGRQGRRTRSAALGRSGSFNAANVDAYFGDARRVAWWIEHKDIGRLTVGRYESAGVVSTIDLGGISVVASSRLRPVERQLPHARRTDGAILLGTWGSFLRSGASQGRTELVRYDSPTIAGFIFSASVAEGSADYWGTCCATPASSPASASPPASATSRSAIGISIRR